MSLEVNRLTKTYSGRAVVQDVSFRVDGGELVALLGPSGSGKSTILRIIAGLTGADAGRVTVDGIDVTRLPPRARDLGFVFQNYALFEHLTVADNVEFALRVRGASRFDRRARRDELLELIGLGGSARKYPSQLSGGQRPRTARARARAHRPRLLLLDEPFGALDARIRQDLRQGLHELLKRLGTTAVFVTHDQEEAFAVADRIMVLHRGRLLEQGPPEQLYRTPQTEFVASFVGRANLLPGELTPDGIRLRLGPVQPHPEAIPKRVKVLLRPEKVALFPPNVQTGRHDVTLLASDAEVERIEYLGASERVHLLMAGPEGDGDARRYRLEAMRSAEEARRLRLRPGERVTVAARQLHAVTQPNLRLLVLAGRNADGRALLEQTLSYGERSHALVTVLGGAVRDPAVAAMLEHFRQAFAGDLRMIDPGELGLGLWDAARAHLNGERYDLVLVSESLRRPEAVLGLFQSSGAGHVLLAASGRMPLAASESSRWSLLMRGFAASQADLGLLAELAEAARARVEVLDLGGQHRHADVVTRSSTALLLRSVAFTIMGLGKADGAQAPPAFSDSAQLIALDLGPRAALHARQQAWLRALEGRWTLLLAQPDESDLGLIAPTDFLEEWHPALPALHPAAASDDPAS